MRMYGCSRDCEENDWELLPLPHPHNQECSNGAIPAEDGNCCSGGLGIDPEGLIVANYFGCPSAGRDEFDNHAEEVRVSFAVQGSPVGPLEDDGLRFRNCSEEAEERQGVPGSLESVAKAQGFIIGVDGMVCHVTEGLCIRPPLSFTLPRLDPPLCTLLDDAMEGALRKLWPEEEEKPTEEESELASELHIVEKQGSKLAEKSDVEGGADDGVENPQSWCVMEGKCKAWWEHPLGILGSKARQIWCFGIAAVAMGSLILGRRWYRGKHQNHNHALRFQIYAPDKVSSLANKLQVFMHARSRVQFACPYRVNSTVIRRGYKRNPYSGPSAPVIQPHPGLMSRLHQQSRSSPCRTHLL